jgi:hypothetical protein
MSCRIIRAREETAMANPKAKDLAVQFLREQTEIMKQYGDTPKLKGKVYAEALKSATNFFDHWIQDGV